MKNLLLLIFCFISCQISFAQDDFAFNYQGVLTDNGKVLSQKKVDIKISILQERSIVFEENHLVTTNSRGVFSCQIGRGLYSTGNLSTLQFGKSKHFIQIEMDLDGNGNYTIVSDSELLHVPYAMYAEDANVKVRKGIERDKEGYLVNSGDLDSLNEIQKLRLYRDTLYLSQSNQVYLGSGGRNSNLDHVNSSNTIFDLRTLHPEDAHRKIKLLGYHTINDGGGGDWYWDDSNVMVDDSATVVKVDSVESGRWVRVNDEEFINLKIFGARGDNTTNDGQDIQRAINYCVDNNRVLYVPSGVYLIDGNGSFGDSFIGINSGGISIIGDSNEKSVFKEFPGVTTFRFKKMFYFLADNSDIQYVNFEDLVFDKNGVSSSLPADSSFFHFGQAHTIEFLSMNNNTIKKVNFNNCKFRDKIAGHINFASGSIEKVDITNCEFIDFSGNFGQRGDIEFNGSVLQTDINNCVGAYIQSEPDGDNSEFGYERISISNSAFDRLDMAGYSIDDNLKQYYLFNVYANINAGNVYVSASDCNFEFKRGIKHKFRDGSKISNSKVRIQVNVIDTLYYPIQFNAKNQLIFNNCNFICDENDQYTKGFLLLPDALKEGEEDFGYLNFYNCDFLDPNFDVVANAYGNGNMKFKDCNFASKGAHCIRVGGTGVYRGHLEIEDCDFSKVDNSAFRIYASNDDWTFKIKGSYELEDFEIIASGTQSAISNVEAGYTNMSQVYGSSKPTTGKWFKGDYIINDNPVDVDLNPGKELFIHGWRCTESGSATTSVWKPIYMD